MMRKEIAKGADIILHRIWDKITKIENFFSSDPPGSQEKKWNNGSHILMSD